LDGKTLNPNETKELKISFSPFEAKNYEQKITIYYLSDSNKKAEINLSGRGIEDTEINDSLMSDSLILVKIYNETGGANWYNTWNFSQPMDTWWGVWIDENRNVCTLDLSHNNLIGGLNVSGLTKLDYLHCGYNNLMNLNVGGLTNLRYMYCLYNSLTSLDVGGLVNLERTDCGNNNLMNLDFSGLTNLRYLDCYDNSLTSLNVSGCTNLISLNCQNNSLTSLNVSGLTNLNFLDNFENPMKTIYATGAGNFTYSTWEETVGGVTYTWPEIIR